MRAWMLELVIPLLVGAAILVGFIALGQQAFQKRKDHERYTARFADIQVNPPPGISREQFLLDVQYQSEMASQFSILDRELPARLEQAFQSNAWVEKVLQIDIKPTREIEIKLLHRIPVLRAPQQDQEKAVDRYGILLPAQALSRELPLLQGTVERPAGRTGTAWGDIQIERAASTTAYLRQQGVPIEGATVEVKRGEIFITTKNGLAIRWGNPPGAEKTDEPSAEARSARLKKFIGSSATAKTLDLTKPQ